MAKPWQHALSSARKWGGTPEDYIEIHDFMDSSKSTMGDSRHRALTHNTWFVGPQGPLERCFGHTITNSEGRPVSVRAIGEQHILEDYAGRFIPSPQDFLSNMEVQEWMIAGRGQAPSSCVRLERKTESKVFSWD